MSFSVEKSDNDLIFHYEPVNGTEWISERFEHDDEIKIKPFFIFSKSDIIPESITDFVAKFRLGYLENNFYIIKKEKLSINNDVYIDKNFPTEKVFYSIRNVSILEVIDRLYNKQIFLGGNRDDSISYEKFKTLISSLPTDSEIKNYVDARFCSVANEILNISNNAQQKYENFLNKKLKNMKNRRITDIQSVNTTEIEKYKYISSRIEEMLKLANTFNENRWQDEILSFILLIFPSYISTINKLNINEEYSKNRKTRREIDIALVDVNGNIDIIEIKKPFNSCITSNSKYRDNYIPSRELSGTIVQAQKYIFYLSKLGKSGEDKLGEKYKNVLPSGINIKITNPRALLIMGRDNNLSENQKFDFEIFKRKYADIIDIITYDDLLRRLQRIIKYFEKQSKTGLIVPAP